MVTKVIIPEDAIENIDYVVCKVCGIKRRKLTTQHLKEHNMTLDDYKKLFPDAPTSCISTRKKYSKIATDIALSKSKEERIQIAKRLNKCWWNKYDKMSEADKQKYKDKLSENISSGIQKNKKDNPKRYKMINEKRSKVRKKLFSDEKTSELMRYNSKKGAINLWNKLSADEKREKMYRLNTANKKMWENMSEIDRMNFLKSHFSSSKSQYIIGNKSYDFRSKFEYKVALFLHENKIEFEYESKLIPLEDNHYHLIDFELVKRNTIIECKSLYCKNKTEDEIIKETEYKKECAEQLGYKYIIIWYQKKKDLLEKEIEKILQLI